MCEFPGSQRGRFVGSGGVPGGRGADAKAQRRPGCFYNPMNSRGRTRNCSNSRQTFIMAVFSFLFSSNCTFALAFASDEK